MEEQLLTGEKIKQKIEDGKWDQSLDELRVLQQGTRYVPSEVVSKDRNKVADKIEQQYADEANIRAHLGERMELGVDFGKGLLEEQINDLGVRTNYFQEKVQQGLGQLLDNGNNDFKFNQENADKLSDLRTRYLSKQQAVLRELSILKAAKNIEGIEQVRQDMTLFKKELAQEYNEMYNEYMRDNGISKISPYMQTELPIGFRRAKLDDIHDENQQARLDAFTINVLMNFEEREKSYWETNYPTVYGFFTTPNKPKMEGEKLTAMATSDKQMALDRYGVLEQQFNNPNMLKAMSPAAAYLIEKIKNDITIPNDKKLEAYFQISDTQNVNLGRLDAKEAQYYRADLDPKAYFNDKESSYASVIRTEVDSDVVAMQQKREEIENKQVLGQNEMFYGAGIVALLEQLLTGNTQSLNQELNRALQPTLEQEKLERQFAQNPSRDLDNRNDLTITHQHKMGMKR